MQLQDGVAALNWLGELSQAEYQLPTHKKAWACRNDCP